MAGMGNRAALAVRALCGPPVAIVGPPGMTERQAADRAQLWPYLTEAQASLAVARAHAARTGAIQEQARLTWERHPSDAAWETYEDAYVMSIRAFVALRRCRGRVIALEDDLDGRVPPPPEDDM